MLEICILVFLLIPLEIRWERGMIGFTPLFWKLAKEGLSTVQKLIPSKRAKTEVVEVEVTSPQSQPQQEGNANPL